MSVGTHIAGRNLAPYHRVALAAGLEILIAPQLPGLAATLRITRVGRVTRRLGAELHAADGPCPS